MVTGSRILREKQCEITPGRLLGGGKRAKADIADYELVYRNTKVATIEAKAWDKPFTEGVGQAKSYATKLAVRFAYATKGQKIYGIDMATGYEGDLAQYPSPGELWTQTFAKADAASAQSLSVWRDRFAAIPLLWPCRETGPDGYPEAHAQRQHLRLFLVSRCTCTPSRKASTMAF